MRYLLLIGAWLVSVSLSAQLQMTPELLWDLERVSGGVPNPDGSQVLYGVTSYDVQDNRGSRNLFLVPAEGGEPVQLTSLSGTIYDEQWRPDGQKIGFIATHAGVPQVFEVNPDGSGLRQVTFSQPGITHFAYSPAGDKVWFTAKVSYPSKVAELYPDLPKANARIIDDLMYRHWDAWDDHAHSHLFVAPYTEGRFGASVDVMQDEPYDTPLEPFGGASQIAWAPDGKGVVYTCKKLTGKEYAQSTNSELYYYDVDSQSTTNLTAGMPGYDRDPVFSPSGEYMLWTSLERAGFESDRKRLFMLDWATGEKTELSEGLDRDVLHPVWSADEKTVYFITGEEATYQVYAMDVKRQKIEPVTEGTHNYQHIARLDDNTLVGTRMDMTQPTELFLVDTRKGEQQQLTFTNATILDRLTKPKVESRWITTTDGKEMLTWVIYPPNFDPTKKYPTLLYCQGGPQSAVSQFFSFRWNFQLMASQGYIVVAPNRRGLPSFGREWNDQISGDWGGQNMEDYLSAIDALKKERYVDEKRLGAVGASYGGYSVYWLAGHHNKRFKAFIAHCGLFNLESWYGTTEELFFANWDVGGPYWDVHLRSKYEAFSPHRFVQNWDTPILVIHGEKDFRVPVSEGMQAFQAAQIRDVPSRFLYFPDEGHWVLRPQNGILWHRVFFDWLDQYLNK